MHLSWYDIIGDPQGWIDVIRSHLCCSLYLFAVLLVVLVLTVATCRIWRRCVVDPYIMRRTCMRMGGRKMAGVVMRSWPSFGVPGEDRLRK